MKRVFRTLLRGTGTARLLPLARKMLARLTASVDSGGRARAVDVLEVEGARIHLRATPLEGFISIEGGTRVTAPLIFQVQAGTVRVRHRPWQPEPDSSLPSEDQAAIEALGAPLGYVDDALQFGPTAAVDGIAWRAGLMQDDDEFQTAAAILAVLDQEPLYSRAEIGRFLRRLVNNGQHTECFHLWRLFLAMSLPRLECYLGGLMPTLPAGMLDDMLEVDGAYPGYTRFMDLEELAIDVATSDDLHRTMMRVHGQEIYATFVISSRPGQFDINAEAGFVLVIPLLRWLTLVPEAKAGSADTEMSPANLVLVLPEDEYHAERIDLSIDQALYVGVRASDVDYSIQTFEYYEAPLGFPTTPPTVWITHAAPPVSSYRIDLDDFSTSLVVSENEHSPFLMGTVEEFAEWGSGVSTGSLVYVDDAMNLLEGGSFSVVFRAEGYDPVFAPVNYSFSDDIAALISETINGLAPADMAINPAYNSGWIQDGDSVRLYIEGTLIDTFEASLDRHENAAGFLNAHIERVSTGPTDIWHMPTMLAQLPGFVHVEAEGLITDIGGSGYTVAGSKRDGRIGAASVSAESNVYSSMLTATNPAQVSADCRVIYAPLRGPNSRGLCVLDVVGHEALYNNFLSDSALAYMNQLEWPEGYSIVILPASLLGN